MASAVLSVASRNFLDGKSELDQLVDSLATISLSDEHKYTSGQIYANEQTLSGATSWDLTDLENPNGEVINFATVFELIFLNDDTVNALTLDGTSMLHWLGDITHDAIVESASVAGSPGLFRVRNTNGWTVTDGADDVLTATPAAGTPTIRIFIIGAE